LRRPQRQRQFGLLDHGAHDHGDPCRRRFRLELFQDQPAIAAGEQHVQEDEVGQRALQFGLDLLSRLRVYHGVLGALEVSPVQVGRGVVVVDDQDRDRLERGHGKGDAAPGGVGLAPGFAAIHLEQLQAQPKALSLLEAAGGGAARVTPQDANAPDDPVRLQPDPQLHRPVPGGADTLGEEGQNGVPQDGRIAVRRGEPTGSRHLQRDVLLLGQRRDGLANALEKVGELHHLGWKARGEGDSALAHPIRRLVRRWWGGLGLRGRGCAVRVPHHAGEGLQRLALTPVECRLAHVQLATDLSRAQGAHIVQQQHVMPQPLGAVLGGRVGRAQAIDPIAQAATQRLGDGLAEPLLQVEHLGQGMGLEPHRIVIVRQGVPQQPGQLIG